jgi:hypothetical protein
MSLLKNREIRILLVKPNGRKWHATLGILEMLIVTLKWPAWLKTLLPAKPVRKPQVALLDLLLSL